MSPIHGGSGARRFWELDYKLKLLVLFIAPVTLFYVAMMLANMFNYAVGERTGVLSKISKKGVACWTMEGEMAAPSFSRSGNLRDRDTSVDNTFYFSIPDPNVLQQLEAASPGSAVTVRYNQKLFALDLPLPMMCRRRTQYEATGVKLAPTHAPEGGQGIRSTRPSEERD